MADPSRSNSIVIAGGSGFVGLSLATHLAGAGRSVVLLSRRAPKVSGPWRHVAWDARTPGAWCRELDGAAGLVNLAGRSVDCIKTPDNQDEILRSRVESTRALGYACRHAAEPPPVWVQMSTAHIYGDSMHAVCSEESATGYGFAPFVARAWEEAFHESLLPTQRPVVLRTSFVLGRDRGAGASALSKLMRIARLGLGGPVGTGKQGVSWIHETDLNRLVERAITESSMRDVYIASSPEPVSQREFMRELRNALGVWFGLPASEWMVRLAAPLVLRTDPELALYGRYVVSKRLAEEHFEFKFCDLRKSLQEVFAGHPTQSIPERRRRGLTTTN